MRIVQQPVYQNKLKRLARRIGTNRRFIATFHSCLQHAASAFSRTDRVGLTFPPRATLQTARGLNAESYDATTNPGPLILHIGKAT